MAEACSDEIVFNILKGCFDNWSKKQQDADYDLRVFSRRLKILSKHSDADICVDTVHILSYVLYLKMITSGSDHDTFKDLAEDCYSSFRQQLDGFAEPNALFKQQLNATKLMSEEKILLPCLQIDKEHVSAKKLFVLLYSVESIHLERLLENIMVNFLTKIDPKQLDILMKFALVQLLNRENESARKITQNVIKRTWLIFDSYLSSFLDKALWSKDERLKYSRNDIYDLIYQLNLVESFSSLFCVIQDLEKILKKATITIEEKLKILKLLGNLFSDKNSQYQYKLKSVWQTFISSFQDKNFEVRNCCISFTAKLLRNHPKFKGDLSRQLKKCATNSVVSTRLSVVQAIQKAIEINVANIDKLMLKILLKMSFDIKFEVREVALKCLCEVFSAWVSSDKVDDSTEMALIDILNKVLNAYHCTEIKDQILIERLVHFYLIPYHLPIEKLIVRICFIVSFINSDANTAFKNLLSKQKRIRQILQNIIKLHEDQEREDYPELIKNQIQLLSNYMPEPATTITYLNQFFQLLENGNQVNNHLKQLLNYKCTWEDSAKHLDYIFKECENFPDDFKTALKELLQRSVLLLFDRHVISLLIAHVNQNVDDFFLKQDNLMTTVERKLQLLQLLSNLHPILFDSTKVFNKLSLLLTNDKLCNCPTIVEWTLKIFNNLSDQNLANFQDCVSKYLMPKLITFAYGGNKKQVKLAVQCLTCFHNDSMKTVYIDFYKSAVEQLKIDGPQQLKALNLIGYLAYYDPTLFHDSLQELESFFIRFKNFAPSTSDKVNISLNVKIKAEYMKCFVRYLIGFNNAKKFHGQATVSIFLNFLTDVCVPLGETSTMNQLELSLLKVTAGSCVIKLTTISCFSNFLSNRTFRALSMLVMDEDLKVRQQFVCKLNKLLMQLKLPVEYISLFSFGALEINLKLKDSIKKYVVENLNNRINDKLQNLIKIIPYAIYLLANPSIYKIYPDPQQLHKLKICLWLLIEPLIKINYPYNYGMVKKQLRRLKQTINVGENEIELYQNEKVYSLCDLALGMLKTKAKSLQLIISEDSSFVPIVPEKLFKIAEELDPDGRIYLPSNFDVKFPDDSETDLSISSEAENSNEDNANGEPNSTRRKRQSTRSNTAISGSKRSRTNEI